MAFKGPAFHDLNNVYALNAALLDVVAGQPGLIQCPEGLCARLRALGSKERARLARTPLLLLSVGEHDASRWAAVFEARHCHDLVSEMQRPPARVAELTCATLGFLWQLACRDPYAARVLCGASIEWCELLAGSLLLDVLDFGGREPSLLTLRLQNHATFWNKLLYAGTCGEREVRLAARVCALQTALTGNGSPRQRPVRAAACAIGAGAVAARR